MQVGIQNGIGFGFRSLVLLFLVHDFLIDLLTTGLAFLHELEDLCILGEPPK